MWWWRIHRGHLAKDLQEQGHNVRVVDKKPLEQWYQPVEGTEQLVLDLELRENCMKALEGMDMVYNLACNMGGMGFIENNHALCMLSVLINVHMLVALKEHGIKDFLYSSSACAYPTYKQTEVKSAARSSISRT